MNNQFNFIRPLLRGWIIIAAAMILSYVVANKYLSYVTPMYESTAKLRLADHNEGVPNSNLFKDFDVFASTQKIQAEIELITSQSIIKKALSRVNFETTLIRQGNLKNTELFSDAPIEVVKIKLDDKLLDKPFLIQVTDTINYNITDPDGKSYKGKFDEKLVLNQAILLIGLNRFLINKRGNLHITDNFVLTFNSEAKQISEAMKHLDVIAVEKDVPVIRISYKSSHPEKAALFPNALAQAFIDDYIENKFGAANLTSNFLDGRIGEISKKLSNSENAILNYRNQKDITNIKQETETDLRKISQLKIQQTNLKMSLNAIKQLEQYMDKGKDRFLELAPNFEAFTDLLSTEMVKKIKQLQSEKKDLLLVYTANDEKVLTIDAKIDDLSTYLRESISNTRKNLQSKYDNLTKDIERAQEVFVTVPEKEKMMTILNREFEIYQQSYNFLNQKKIEADIAKAAKIAFHRVITPAIISKQPVSPNRTIIKGVAVILGMLGAMLLIFITHSLKARVNNITTVENKSLIRVIASIPKLKTQHERQKFFLTTITQWKVKKIMEPGGILCFTGFNKFHASIFITNEVCNTLVNQGRKVLLVNERNNPNLNDLLILNQLPNGASMLSLNTAKLLFSTTEDIQNLLRKHSLEFDHTIILNADFGESITLALMSMSTLNVVCIDTRLTPAKMIDEVNLLTTDYQLPNVYFALNRVGYNPSFLKELFKCMKKYLPQNQNKL